MPCSRACGCRLRGCCAGRCPAPAARRAALLALPLPALLVLLLARLLAPPRAGGAHGAGAPLPGGIPRILHQQWGDRPLPPLLAAWRQSWRRCLGDGWELRLWTDAENRELVARHFPELLATYDGYAEEIKRIDAIRYVYLSVFGGVYADLDLECLSSPEALLAGHPAVLAYAVPWCYCEAALMAGRPGHPLFRRALELLPGSAHLDVRLATGSYLLTRAFENYTGASDYHVHDQRTFPAADPGAEPVHVLGSERVRWDWCPPPLPGFEDYPRAFARNHYAGTWITPEHRALRRPPPGTPAAALPQNRKRGCTDFPWAGDSGCETRRGRPASKCKRFGGWACAP